MVPVLLFWISIFLLLHTYVLYPLLLQLLSSGRKGNDISSEGKKNYLLCRS